MRIQTSNSKIYACIAASVIAAAAFWGCAGGRSGHGHPTFSDSSPVELVGVIDGSSLQQDEKRLGRVLDVATAFEPVSIAPLGAGGLLIADRHSGGIVRLELPNMIVAVTTGSSISALQSRRKPRIVRSDIAGSVYLTDGVNDRVDVYDQALRRISDFQPPYFALNLPSGQLFGLALGAYGEMYVSDRFNGRVYRFDASTAFIGEFKGEETPWARIHQPAGLTCDDKTGNVVVCDVGERRITVFDNTGAAVRSFGQAELREPVSVAVDLSGQIFVADAALRAIVVFDQSGRYLGRIDSARLGSDEWGRLTDVAVVRNRIFVADPDMGRVLILRYGRVPKVVPVEK